MWGAILRFIAANITGLAVGYSARDLAAAASGADDDSDEKKSWLTRIMQKVFGLPAWAAGVFGLILLGFIAYKAGWVTPKRK